MNPPLDLTRVPQTDPLEIYRHRDGLYATDLLTAAICELDFFTWLATHPSSAREIGRELGLAERPLDVMLSLFAAEGFIQRDAETFRVTELAREHLVRSSPFFLGAYFGSMKERPVVRDYITVLRTGKPANWGSYRDEKAWSEAMLTDTFATTFTAAMDCRGFYLGPAMARTLDLRHHSRLLDIAGGSGVFACTLIAHHRHLRASVFERAPVDHIARTIIAARGFAPRVDVIAGDMFHDPLPTGHDLHLYSNVLHDWDVAQVRQLLAASFRALDPGGTIIVHDAHLNAEKTGPLPVAKYSALLMAITEGKCYSVAEMDALLTEAGFRDMRYAPTVADRSVITARKPAATE